MTNNKQQTAVEWFHQKTWDLKIQLEKGEISIGEYANTYATLYEQAKEMEKEQTINFTDDWYFYGPLLGEGIDVKNTIEQHYNQTYGDDKQ
jgi:hypothetical protein